MVYKKYIKKNGKLYGPYIYHSRRVNGKVISEYHGSNKWDYKKLVFFFGGILFLILLIIFIFTFNGKITGRTVENSELNPQIENSLSEEKIVYPVVYFTLISRQIQNDNSEETGLEPSDSSEIEPNIKEIEEQLDEIPPENQTIENIEENITIQADQNESEEITTIPDTNNNSNMDSETENSEQIEESSKEFATPEQTEIPASEEQETDSLIEEDEDQEINEENPAPITGGVISQIFTTISNFFLNLKLTGGTISEKIITEIKGKVSFDEPFIYNLKDGETVELLSGTVETESQDLSDNIIQINYQDNQVLITTNYSEIIYISNNQTDETNSIQNTIKENFSITPLSEKEKQILDEKFGNISVEKIKTELFNERYIIKYQLGEYNIEYSYDSNLDNETLKSQIEIDKIKWIRDIIHKLSGNETMPVPVDLP